MSEFVSSRGLLVPALFLVACSGGKGDGSDAPKPCPEESGVICPYAGTGQAGFNGAGLDKLDSWLYFPMDIVISPYGNPVISDWNNHKLRLVEDDDTLTTIMGTAFVGDGDLDKLDLTIAGAPGTEVNLNHPTQARYEQDGTLLSASWHTHKLRTWDPTTGLVHVILGLTPDFVGDNMEDAHTARMNQPVSVELDQAGNIYIVDMRNERVRFLDTKLWEITTIAGNGDKGFAGDGGIGRDATLSFPRTENPEPGGAVAFSADESKLYIADTENHAIRVLDMATRVIDTYAGVPETPGDVDGDRLTAQFNKPRDLVMSPDGLLYVADSDNNKVRVIDTASGLVSTYAGTGEPSCPGDGAQYIPRTCDAQATGGDGGDRLDATLYRPFGVELDLDGNVVVADTFDHRFRIIYR